MQIERNIRLSGKDVLELGCGFGRLRKLFATANRSVHVDTSPELLEVAMEKNRNMNAKFVQADINFLPKNLTEDLFDSVILLQICMHLRDPFWIIGNASGILRSKGEIWVDFTCATGFEATAEFQKIIDHPGVVVNDPIGAMAHLQLARSHVVAGDTLKAKARYRHFLTLWKAHSVWSR